MILNNSNGGASGIYSIYRIICRFFIDLFKNLIFSYFYFFMDCIIEIIIGLKIYRYIYRYNFVIDDLSFYHF